MARHESFLVYGRYRHLKLALLLIGVSLAAYVAHAPVGGRHGSSPVGYGLGILCAALVLWLLAFGVRKRRYASSGASVRAWLSAHVYLGATLVFLVPLHAAFELGWNVHTLAYALLCGVVLSGMIGVGVYAAVPTLMTRNRPGEKLTAMLQRIAEIDGECRSLSRDLDDRFSRAIALSIEETRIGGGILRQLSGREPRCGTSQALLAIKQQAGSSGSTKEAVSRLIELLARKQVELQRVRRDVRLKALLDLWLLVHVPLSIATLAAVATHVFVVLYHW